MAASAAGGGLVADPSRPSSAGLTATVIGASLGIETIALLRAAGRRLLMTGQPSTPRPACRRLSTPAAAPVSPGGARSDAGDMTPFGSQDAQTPGPRTTAPRTTRAGTTAWLLLCALMASVLMAMPAHGQARKPTPTFPYFCMDGLGKPQLCIQWSKRDVRRFDDLVAGVGATAATQWLCDQVPKSPAQLAVRAGCVAALGLYFGHIIRAFQVAADKGQCVRLRFIIPPAAINGVWRIRC